MGKQGVRSKYGGGSGGPSERLLHPATHIASAPDRLGDLDEADVWSVGDGNSSSHRPDRRWPAGGLSLAFDAQPHQQHQQQHHQNHHEVAGSAPVSVPEWPATTANNTTTAASSATGSSWDDESSEEWVAPHEYLQRRRGAASVLVGAGRTLKGRDMSRVRDAVWSNTGFFG